ncbi:hypothetical protein SBO82_11420 [Alcaligenes nematophilus]|uniref:hypothetical protein n=1 Tax=Alcaligenes nematophilus TaxID=2994643 RepID=UPI00245DAE2F|nr:hypothetical protein [Alcaligenes nematophilus]MDH4867576.1 hypothetical protein [Bacillus cereus]MDY7128884.1 hypothetical protein [Alcaligenes nematophilus]
MNSTHSRSLSINILYIYIFFTVYIGATSLFAPLNEYGEMVIPKDIYIFFDLFSILIFFVLLFSSKWNIKNPDPIFIFWFIFVFSLFIFSARGAYSLRSIDYIHYFFRNQIFYVFLGGLIYHYCSSIEKNRFNSFLFLLLCSQLIFSFIIVLLEYSIGGFFWEGSRLTGTLLNHNSYGVFLTFFSFWIWYSYEGKFSTKIFIWSLIALLITLSGSVTAIIGLFLSIARNLKMVIFLGLATVIGFWLFFDDIMNLHFIWKINQIFFEKSTHLTSLSAREMQLQLFLDSISNPVNWVFGASQNNSYMLFDSQYYNIFFNFGIIPVFLFLLLAATIIKKHSNNWYSIYYSWFFLFACSMTAFFSRPIIIILFFFFLANTGLPANSSIKKSNI